MILPNCTKARGFRHPASAYGESILLPYLITLAKSLVLQCRRRMIRSENIFFCIRNRPSPWKINKKQQVGTVLSGRAKRSSRRHHAAFAAVRTGADVDFPDSFQQFCHTHASITAFVFLAALNTEDQLQVL